MKWREKVPPKEGDLRHVTRFLWMPLTIAKQVRFWERATWVEQCVVWRGEVHWEPITWRITDSPAAGKGFLNLYRRFLTTTTSKVIT